MLFSAGMGTQQIVLIVLVVLLVIVLIVMPIFTNKKRQQSVNTLHNSLKVGDKVMTIGGIIGTVTDVRQTSPVDKEFTIETGEDGRKTTMVLDIKALYQILPAASATTAVEPTAKTEEPAVTETTVADVFEEHAVESEPVEEKVKEEVKEEPVAETEASVTEEAKAEEPKPVSKPRTSTRKPVSKK